MISFKHYRSAVEFGTLDPRLLNVIIPELQRQYEKIGASTLVVTSVFRLEAPTDDHPDWRAIDARVWSLSEAQRMKIACEMNDKFPVPDGERPTVTYYSPENTGGKYAAHFHVRVPKIDHALHNL